MTREQAIQLMEQGKKVTHRYFSPEEYITIKDGKIVTEEGYPCVFTVFWSYRSGGAWETDWEEFKETPSPSGSLEEAASAKLKTMQYDGSYSDDQMIEMFLAGASYSKEGEGIEIVSELRGCNPYPEPDRDDAVWNECCNKLAELLNQSK